MLKCPSHKGIVEEVVFSQGKEIVKIKQENKALRESSVSNGDSSSGGEIFTRPLLDQPFVVFVLN